MSLNLTIAQKGLFKKTLPLSTILGDRLKYGAYDGSWRLQEGKMTAREFTAFLPDAIGRGFSVIWNPAEKQCVELRLPTPSARAEIQEFYAVVTRITRYWNGELSVEGEKMSLQQFVSGMEQYMDFNASTLQSFREKINESADKELTIFAAFWPLYLGEEEARLFADPAAFDVWLHEKQSMDAFYAAPRFFRKDKDIIGVYAFTEDCETIFPRFPSVPFGTRNPADHQELRCDKYEVAIFSTTEDREIGALDFDSFIRRLPANKLTRYDARCVRVAPMDLRELQKLLAE